MVFTKSTVRSRGPREARISSAASYSKARLIGTPSSVSRHWRPSFSIKPMAARNALLRDTIVASVPIAEPTSLGPAGFRSDPPWWR